MRGGKKDTGVRTIITVIQQLKKSLQSALPLIFQIRKLRLIKSDYLPKSTVNKSGSPSFPIALFSYPGIREKTLTGKS